MTDSARRALLVVLAAVTVNAGSLLPGFIHDDHRIVEQDTRTLSRPASILATPYWSAADQQAPNLYRPVTIASYALERAIHGLRPAAFRTVNLALHALCAFLVLLLARRLLAADGGAWGVPWLDPPTAAALLFAVHPIHTEALGEIVGRAELLSAAAALGGTLAFLNGGYVAALVLFAIGFLSKENAVAIPAFFLLADILLVRRRPAWRFHTAAGILLVLLLALRAAVLGGPAPAGGVHFIDNPIAHLPFVEGRLTALAVLARYAALFAWPAALSIDYSYRALPVAPPAGAAAGAVLVAAATVVLARAWRRRPDTAFAIGWTAAAFAPVANLIVPIGTILAERLLYLPSVGLCLLAGVAYARWANRPTDEAAVRLRRRRIAAAAASIVLAACAARSAARLRDWHDDFTIFASAVRRFPESVRAQFNYGAQCEKRGDDAAARRAYETALAIWPDFADAHYNLAGVLERARDLDAAAAHYRAALERRPMDVQSLVNLGHTLIAQKRYAEARDVLRRALAVDPASALAHTEMGAAALGLSDAQSALASYREAARLEPANPDFLRNLGIAQREARDPEAAATFRRALEARPGDPDLLDGLGMTLLDQGDPAAAVDALRRAVGARPGHPVYRYHLATALERQGDADGAVAEYREAIRIAPNAAPPYAGLGRLLARRGDRDGALAALERAAALGAALDEDSRALLERLRGRAGTVSGRRGGTNP